MISDGHIDRLIDGIAHLAASVLDEELGTPTATLDSALQELENESTAHGLQGIFYVMRLLRKVQGRRPPGAMRSEDAERFAAFIGDLTVYAMGQTDSAHSSAVLDDLLAISWFPNLPSELTSLVRERLARDADRLAREACAAAMAAASQAPLRVVGHVPATDDVIPPASPPVAAEAQEPMYPADAEGSGFVVSAAADESGFAIGAPPNGFAIGEEAAFAARPDEDTGLAIGAVPAGHTDRYAAIDTEEDGPGFAIGGTSDGFSIGEEDPVIAQSDEDTGLAIGEDHTFLGDTEPDASFPLGEELPEPGDVAADAWGASPQADEPAFAETDANAVAWVAPEELELVIEAVSSQLLPLAGQVQYSDDLAGQMEAIAAYREQFDLITAAAEALNLPGLERVCIHFSGALEQYGNSSEPLDPDALSLLGEWPVMLIGYLQSPTERSAATDLAATLCVAQPWGVSPPQVESLVDLLVNVAIGLDPALKAARKTLAEPDDIALDIAEDVLPTVLAGMLHELPGRASEFSARIQRFVRTGDADDLDAARRIAHTLKGDGNIVGVRGIANLTHNLEEILIKLAEEPGIPVAELADVLVESADCLESMSDFVLRRGPQPDNALEVLQSVLNWANALLGESVSATAERPQAAPVAEAPVGETPAPAAAEDLAPEVAPEQTITVPMSLLDHLLRLTGEAVIYARQIENRVARIDQRAGEIAGQNEALQTLVAELQQLVEVRGAAVGSVRLGMGDELDALEMDRYNELHTVTLRLVEASVDARTTNNDVGQDIVELRDLLSLQDRIHLDLQGQVLKTRTLPVSGLLPRLQRVVRQTARQLGKQCDIHFDGETTAVDHEIIDRLAEPLIHMLRNSVDHGIEYPEERRASGKPDHGHIALSFQRDAGVVRIRCTDDGRGLDLEAIHRKGIERGLIAADQPVTPEQISQLIFRPGFSTRNEVTQTSGRGIGMDIVHRSIAQLKGSLTLKTEPGQGCEFEIQLPVSQVVAEVLLTQTDFATVALVLHGIERLIALEPGDFLEKDGQLFAQVQKQTLPVYGLENLLGYSGAPVRRARHSALMAKAGPRGSALIIVDRLGEARSVIVKGLGACVPPLPGVLGATILGNGAVAPVVDLLEVIGVHERLRQGQIETLVEATPVEAPLILIVDDSLSVRRSLEQLVVDAGFEATTARDGLEAVERVRERRPNLMLVDLEMPRMNGLELTSFIRKNPSTRNIPVVMITSRTTERHRELARDAGVDTILSKPYSEEDLLRLIERSIGGAAAAA
ncbi:hybrid sensor histidine kinase/response regulator [Tahibacter amnicola]|uniref:histidine kinase n=1 Tax=Tahibacter amnicola TaxID=2976241 RepID=A0ABY6BGI2_9GAMM|nr:response regulator [Tahibacter amnicola]UXI69141.1 response regulator [Tahibacter amnicola]